MRKGIQKWVFAVGIVVGGAFGAVSPSEAQASSECYDRCADESCTCVYQCFPLGPHCICEGFPVCY